MYWMEIILFISVLLALMWMFKIRINDMNEEKEFAGRIVVED